MYSERVEPIRKDLEDLGFVIPHAENDIIALYHLYGQIDTYPIALLVNHQNAIICEFRILQHVKQIDPQHFMEEAIATILQTNGFDMKQVYEDGKQQYIIREARKLGMVFPEGSDDVD